MQDAAGTHPLAPRAVTLPDEIRTDIEHDLGVRIERVDGVGGGCISPAYRLRCADGVSIFLKTAPPSAPDDMLAQEAVSLERIAATDTVRVPRVLARPGTWLALEWLEPARGSDAGWAVLGAELARMHRSSAEQYGWESPNFIGPLPQANERSHDWPSFWGAQRLRPQLRQARDRLGGEAIERFEQLLEELDERLSAAVPDGASLLHGDLWAGNVHFTAGGVAVIDPSSYYGHREVDLAMAALFGGFPPAFFDAYSAEWPLHEGADARRGIYQLYYLLVHVNLFGGGYVAQTGGVLASVLSRRPD
ncbi:MAG: fructosamine kinase family protein [Gemmatimonadetes bacterium]|nr:fructosamine kinase family protein [Gemmatimonadota bacterium]